ncbi:BOS complex subunit ncln [Topomyia yanbarensis]|uniref:BOS complex subunit ncln n=1 Tax=Topomyia yanbarensis TaxID=2498891 RepID=UPI00273C6759|nr:BOS complex subunit ncln [Topomyia yanbarensis]XP_058824312.1 BOS complex subunit ncln [Topomyia yanbarensis]
MFEDADNFADFLRGGLPYYLLITLPILIICSSNPVLAASEFGVQRMSQYDVHGVPYGCRGSALNMEAKSLYTWQTFRHCVITRFQDMTIDQFREIRAKAGGLVILLPEDVSSLSLEEKQHIHLLEQAMMLQEISIPVYFSRYSLKLNEIINDVTKATSLTQQQSSKQRESAISEILGSISANGYQIAVTGTSNSPNKQSKIPIIQGELTPTKHTTKSMDSENKLPLIILTAHLDTFGLVNGPLKNADVAVLLTLIELFSKLHASIPKYRLMFLVSESGNLLNFQGMKKWLDSNLDENVQIQQAEFVICLDSIGRTNDNIFMHVSKPPKEGTSMNGFYRILKSVAQRYGNITVEGVHKKINLADTLLAWEHERFSMKRMPAFTVSNLKSHKDPLRNTIFEDESGEEQLDKLETNVKILAETLASYIYNLPGDSAVNDGEIFSGSMAISKEIIRPWLHIRSSQQNNDLKYAFEKYLKNVRLTYEKPDAREPDFMLYDDRDAVLNIYNVKPAVFDLFLTFLIVSYLGMIYLAIFYFPKMYTFVCRMTTNKIKGN